MLRPLLEWLLALQRGLPRDADGGVALTLTLTLTLSLTRTLTLTLHLFRARHHAVRRDERHRGERDHTERRLRGLVGGPRVDEETEDEAVEAALEGDARLLRVRARVRVRVRVRANLAPH